MPQIVLLDGIIRRRAAKETRIGLARKVTLIRITCKLANWFMTALSSFNMRL